MWYCCFVNVLLKQHRGKGNSIFFFPLTCFIILKSPISLRYYMLYSSYLINILLYFVYYSLDKTITSNYKNSR